MSQIEQHKNRLNLEMRELLTVISMIDGISKTYPDYKENTLNNEEYLNEQIALAAEAKNRLINIFKD